MTKNSCKKLLVNHSSMYEDFRNRDLYGNPFCASPAASEKQKDCPKGIPSEERKPEPLGIAMIRKLEVVNRKLCNIVITDIRMIKHNIEINAGSSARDPA